MNLVLMEIKVEPVKRLQRDPEIVWSKVIDSIRRGGYTTSEICRILSVARSTLWQWETFESCPNYEDGRALLKLAVLTAPESTTFP